jgi:hypothetical protein
MSSLSSSKTFTEVPSLLRTVAGMSAILVQPAASLLMSSSLRFFSASMGS